MKKNKIHGAKKGNNKGCFGKTKKAPRKQLNQIIPFREDRN